MDRSDTPLRDVLHEALLRAITPDILRGPLVIACSGGADSIALLFAAIETFGATHHVVAAHLDHGLRSGSADEARFVVRLAAQLGVECVHERRPVRPEGGESPEEAARRVRYGFLADACRAHDAALVATAHHADDQAETLLLNLMRGTGLEGLRGMPHVRPLQNHEGAFLVRPFLHVRRAALEADLRARGVSWCEDPTNREDNLRAQVRHRLLPLMESLSQRDPVPLLLRLARHVEAAQVVSPDEPVERCFVAPREGEIHVVAGYGHLPERSRREALSWALRKAYPGRHLPAEQTLHRLDRWLCGERSESPSGFRIEPREPGIQTVRRDGASDAFRRGLPGFEPAVALPVPGAAELPARQVRVTSTVAPATPRTFLRRLRARPGALELLDAERVDGALSLRRGLSSDRFAPLGTVDSVRLGGYLARRDVPLTRRDGWPVVADRTGIVWVVGHGIADRVKLSDDVERILVLRREHL